MQSFQVGGDFFFLRFEFGICGFSMFTVGCSATICKQSRWAYRGWDHWELQGEVASIKKKNKAAHPKIKFRD